MHLPHPEGDVLDHLALRVCHVAIDLSPFAAHFDTRGVEKMLPSAPLRYVTDALSRALATLKPTVGRAEVTTSRVRSPAQNNKCGAQNNKSGARTK